MFRIDVGDVLTRRRGSRELVQDAVDLHGGHTTAPWSEDSSTRRRALPRSGQFRARAARRPRSAAARVVTRLHVELVGADQLLPIFADRCVRTFSWSSAGISVPSSTCPRDTAQGKRTKSGGWTTRRFELLPRWVVNPDATTRGRQLLCGIRGDVADRGHHEAGRLESAQRGFWRTGATGFTSTVRMRARNRLAGGVLAATCAA